MKLAYHAFYLAEKVIKKVPIKISRAVAHAGGDAYYFLSWRKRRIIKRNMRRALGPGASDEKVRKTARRACRYYAEYWVDILWLPTLSRQYILDRFDRIDAKFLHRTIAEGKGTLVVLPHFGSWEAGAVFLSSLGPFAAVAEVLKPPELFDLFVKLREGVGIRIFPYDGTAETREDLIQALKDGTMIALLCDRDLKGTGVEVEFFGEQTTLPPGPAALALRSGSPIVCVNVRNLGDDKWIGHATEPMYANATGDREADIKAIMQQVAHRLEELIREDPAQWHMFMPSWPSDRK